MTDSINVLAKELAKAIPSKSKTSPYDTQAVVKRIDGDTAWVHIPGGVDETPVQMTSSAKKGDIVQVRVSGGRAWLYGNATNPPTDDSKANEVGKNLIQTETEIYETIVHTEKEIYKEIAADKAEIGELIAEKADIDDLTAATARIGSLEADHVSVSDFQAEQANIDSLQAATADIDTIRANSAKVQNLTAAQLEADHATVGSLDTNYAQINLANVNNAWIENGLVKNAAIGDAQISGVSASKLTAGTINAGVIDVVNLKADNITTGTLNGQRIGTGSLSLDKLNEAVYTETEIDDMLDDIQAEIDGAIETYTGTVVPTLNNYPASSWSTSTDRDKHVGDIYYVVNNAANEDGYCYRFTKSNNVYSWVLIKDSDVTAALQRLTEAEGDIQGLQTFESTTTSWISNTNTELNSLKTRTTNVETSLGDKVSTSTFNELSQTVDENTSSISSLSTTVQSKADSSTVTTLSNTVNTVQQTANTNSSHISSLTTTLGTNADGTTKTGDVMHKVSDVTQDLNGFKTTVGQTYQTKDAMSNYSTTTQMNTAISQSASGILSTVSATYATQNDLDDVEDRVSTAESTIDQHAESIELKVSKNGVISSINQSSESITINANRVNIAGAAIFTSGRLSETNLNSTYDSKGSAAAVAEQIPDDISDLTDEDGIIPTKVSELTNDSGFQTANDVSGAITTATSDMATKTAAVSRQQRIYRRETASTSLTGPTTWLSTSGTGYGNWSTRVPQLTSGTTKYPFLYTCVQTQTIAQQASGTTCTCSPVLLDDSTTVIDGGTIITGTLNANAVNASSGTFNTANIPNLDASKITTGSLDADRIKANVIFAINSLTAGQINAARINASQLSIGQSQVTNLTTDLAGKASTDAAWTVSIEVSSINYSTPTATLVAKPYYYGTLTTTGITYQWSKNGTNISGATNSTYTTSDLNAAYTCTIS